MKFYKTLSLIIAVFLQSCTFQENDLKKITTLINEYNPKIEVHSYKAIIFIPIEGCSSCIKESINFLKVYGSEEQYLFVLIANSVKESRMIVGEKSIQMENVMLDSNSLSLTYGLAGVMPVIYQLEHGEISKRIELSIGNSKKTYTALLNL